VHSAFLQQGKADAFTTKAPAQRKQILSDILGLERWAAYEDAAKDRLKKLELTIEGIEARIRDIEDDLAREPELQATLEKAEAEQAAAQAALDEAELKLKEVEHAPRDLQNAQGQKAALERRIFECERDVKTAEDDIQKQIARLSEYESIVAARSEIQAGYEALQAARETDHELGDKLMQLRTFDEQGYALESQLNSARAALQSEAAGYESTIVQLERNIAAADPDELAKVQAEVLALQDLETQRDQFQAQGLALETERSELKAVNNTLLAEMNNIKERIKRLEQVEGVTCPYCGQPLDEAHRRELIAGSTAEGKERGDSFRTNKSRVEAIEVELSNNKTILNDIALELKRLAARRDHASRLQHAVDHANEAAVQLAETQAQLAAVRQTLADETFGQDIRAQMAALEAQRAALGYSSEEHNAARQQLETYREFEVRHQKLEVALDSLDGQRALLEAAEARRERALKARDEEREALNALEIEMVRLKALAQEFTAREHDARVARAKERTARDSVVEAKQELRALESQRNRKQELEQQCEEQKHQRGIYDELKVAFGKNGIPAMIIETAIPELETSANGILRRMTDGRMNLALSTQREKVTGGTAETLDIQIADELGTRSYEMYSGGEAFRINFAIRVALSQMLARRAGAHLRTLFIDEGFGTQDEDGRNKLIEAITAVQDDFDMILAITHIDELRDAFPVHIMLEKTGEGSRIRVR